MGEGLERNSEGVRQRRGYRRESELVSDIWVPGRASVCMCV